MCSCGAQLSFSPVKLHTLGRPACCSPTGHNYADTFAYRRRFRVRLWPVPLVLLRGTNASKPLTTHPSGWDHQTNLT